MLKVLFKIPFQNRPAGSTRNPRVHFAEELEVAQEWTPPLDGEEVVFSDASQQKGSNRDYQGECPLRDAYYYEGGRDDRNIDTPPNLYFK